MIRTVEIDLDRGTVIVVVWLFPEVYLQHGNISIKIDNKHNIGYNSNHVHLIMTKKQVDDLKGLDERDGEETKAVYADFLWDNVSLDDEKRG